MAGARRYVSLGLRQEVTSGATVEGVFREEIRRLICTDRIAPGYTPCTADRAIRVIGTRS